jgi:hypothetical protein
MENKEQEKQVREIQKHLTELKKDYQFIFASSEGGNVLADIEKRCHYHSTTNVKGDSHESAYLEGQRSVILFIKSMLQNDKEKGK